MTSELLSRYRLPGMRAWMLASLFTLAASAHAASSTQDFLDVDQAFRVDVRTQGVSSLVIHLDAAPGYHLYRDRFSITAGDSSVLPTPQLPAGRTEYDAGLGQPMTIWTGPVDISLPVGQNSAAGSATVSYQGCADRGLCYPPQSGTLSWNRDTAGHLGAHWLPASQEPAGTGDGGASPAVSAGASTRTAATPPSPAAESNGDAAAAALKSGSLLRVVGLFLLGGLLLSFTPCVLPMLPILSSIIVGQGGKVSRGKGFSLALAYSTGMAMVYTVAGICAGLLGSGFAAALQNPWVLGSFALLLAVLALSMFGAWEFQMPGFIQDRVNAASNQLGGGRHFAVFAMGGLSALLVGPCVAAPLAGALVYISQTRDVVLGGAALFALAMGMSVPLLALGLSAGSLLPRAGGWMEHVKSFFGVLLLAVALWLVSPVIPLAVTMFIAGATTLVLLFWLGAFDSSRSRAWRGLGAVAGLWACAMLGGSLSGADSFLQPLRHLSRPAAAVAAADPQGLSFRRISSLPELDAALKEATRPVVLDMFADWCVACKEMEHLTFRDPAVRGRLEQAVLLQADVTADSPQARQLLKRFGLFGPPAVLFFDARGRELQTRAIGFEPAERFVLHLDAAKL